jgi:hypothetical protein
MSGAAHARPAMAARAREVAIQAKGFLKEAEGDKLFELALEASRLGPCLEIGSYCGKSGIFLGDACRIAGQNPLFSIDHHRGSAEQQPGQEYFDPNLYDCVENRMTTLADFWRNIGRAGLDSWIIPVAADSSIVSRYWRDTSLGLVFIDGGHGEFDVLSDYGCWANRVLSGGYLCFHDVYPDPARGGQAPYQMIQYARALPEWEYYGLFESLGVLRRR